MTSRQLRMLYVGLGVTASCLLILSTSSRPHLQTKLEEDIAFNVPSLSNALDEQQIGPDGKAVDLHPIQELPNPERLAFNKTVQSYNECIIEKYNAIKQNQTTVWERGLQDIVEDCKQKTDIKKIIISPLKNNDEIKHHVFSQYEEPSTIVTLGVGADTAVEEYLKSKLPSGSQFMAADPVYEPNAKMFEKIGLFFPFAVGAETGVSIANIRNNQGNYEKQLMTHIDLEIFFGKLVNKTKIDHLLLDNEGPEYDLMPRLGRNDLFDEMGVTVCQMNVEVHSGRTGFTKDELRSEFIRIIDRILYEQRYVILFSSYYGHQRMFLMNVESNYCVNKYMIQFFSN
ncbi:unnamed protein product [Auanema sp. JU1783]|nr:unnamed protein product [Auanema sp. JU1783]